MLSPVEKDTLNEKNPIANNNKINTEHYSETVVIVIAYYF